jgi:hypothetical protein
VLPACLVIVWEYHNVTGSQVLGVVVHSSSRAHWIAGGGVTKGAESINLPFTLGNQNRFIGSGFQ